eukprot:gene20678-biopygen12625
MVITWCARRTERFSASVTACASPAPVLEPGLRPGAVSQIVQKRPGEQAGVVSIGKPDANGVATDGIERNDPGVIKGLGWARRRGRSVATAFRAG